MRKLTKVEKKALEIWFDEWLLTIDQRLNVWLTSLPEKWSEKLDKSPRSLLVLGQYLAIEFSDPKQARAIENAILFDAIATYIGEVYRLHFPGEGIWRVSFESGPITDQSFIFPVMVGITITDDGKDPFNGISYIINTKDTEKLYKAFLGMQNSYTKIIAQSKQAPIPGKGGESYHHYLLLTDNSIKFSNFDCVLNQYFNQQKLPFSARFYNDKRLLIDAGNDYYFHFYFDDSKRVNVGAIEIANEYNGEKNKAKIKNCQIQFEFWGDEDLDGDFFNEHLYILQYLTTLEQFFIFNCDNRVFFDEM